MRRHSYAWDWTDDAIMALFWFVLCVASVTQVGCSPKGLQTQSQVAAVVAVSANEVLPVLEGRYLLEMKMEVDEVVSRDGTADEAQAEVDRVKREWRPIWAAWDAFAEGHAVWRQALQLGDETAAVKAAIHARAAYCHLRDLVPDLPPMPLASCGGGQ